MVGGMVRHLNSLRRMKRDYGWIHTLLEEAENERMHLLTFLEYRQPSAMFRATVLLGQGVMFNSFLLAYMISPQFCHRFVGYLEEEAVKTYTRAVNDIDAGKLPSWEKMPVPAIGRKYWQLAEDSTMRDLLLAIRADEAHHREVNHVFGDFSRTRAEKGEETPNPFPPGY
uniref:Alternative oxidase n=2 Tax=Palpitomonas bilix TaxID=652834 RepID=A0A7S3LU37_9EUKA|mmetsp:Transcript_47035/g.121503  ORF Transcript_47035/g.121503 Transcript_47035/m.121503 type:complete len:170 (+) Transcript_47035:774-1283(+)